jgi:DUF4097 and DUF4098 domain-containing protein YvlB
MRYLPIAAVVVCALAGATARAADVTEHVTRTVRLEPGGTLRLKSFSGRVTITADDRNDVAIDAVRRATRERLQSIKLDIHTEGSNVVVIEANRHEASWYDFIGRNNVVETDFDIKVPRLTSLDISVFSAPVTIEGVSGSHRVHTFSSRLRLEDVEGPIQAHSFSGPVEIRTRSWQPNQTIDVNTFSGNVELRVPDSADASVTFNSFSGHLNSEMPLTLTSGNGRALRARLGSGSGGSGELKFKTFSGNVKIDR